VKLCESAEAPKDQDISLPGKTAIICLKKLGNFGKFTATFAHLPSSLVTSVNDVVRIHPHYMPMTHYISNVFPIESG
jgi:hypothetical protein